MLKENPELTSVARRLGAGLFDYQKIKKFGAQELQNMIFELTAKDEDNMCKEIWKGYLKKSEEYEILQ